MKIQLLLLIFLFQSFPGFAQTGQKKDLTQYYIQQSIPCGGVEEIFKIKGNWKKNGFDDGGGFADKTFPVNKQFEIMSRLEKILPMLKEAIPDLGGFEPTWHRSLSGNSMMAGGPVPSKFTCRLFEYYCNNNTNKIVLADETAALVEISFNYYGFFGKKINQWNINGDGKMITIYQMPDSVGKWQGLKLYEPKITPGSSDRAIVIGHNGKMPWFTLSQKQYLTGYKSYLETQRNEQLEASDTYIKKCRENIAAMQASKAITPEQKKSIVEKLTQQLKDYQQDAKQKNVAASEKIYHDKIKPINEYLDTASGATLAQPALLDKKTNIDFKGYFATPGKAAIKLIAFPSKYFNKELSRYVPQFMIVYWRWGSHPANIKFAKAFEENFPVTKLQALIDQ